MSQAADDAKSDTFVTGGIRTLQEMKLGGRAGEIAGASSKHIGQWGRKIPIPNFSTLRRRWRLWAGVGGAVLLGLLVLVLVFSLRGHGAGAKKDTRTTRGGKSLPPTDAKPVFLADLPEQEVVVGSGKLGKKNDLGYNNAKIVVKGAAVANGLSMHAIPKGTARAVYRLGKKYRVFKATVALNDSAPSSESPLTFMVKGDGRVLWKSTPLQKGGQVLSCAVPIEGVDRLELEVHCPGGLGNGHSVWIDPEVLP